MSKPLALMRLEHPAAARILLHPKAQTCLSALIGTDHTASSLARATALPINTVAYWLRRLHETGLLNMLTQTPQQHYQAAALSFFVPFKSLPSTSLGALYAELHRAHFEASNSSFANLMLESHGDWGVCLSVPEGQPTLTIVDEARNITLNSRHNDAPATVNLTNTLHLDFVAAKALQAELIELYSRYASRSGAQSYLVRLAMVPEQH